MFYSRRSDVLLWSFMAFVFHAREVFVFKTATPEGHVIDPANPGSLPAAQIFRHDVPLRIVLDTKSPSFIDNKPENLRARETDV